MRGLVDQVRAWEEVEYIVNIDVLGGLPIPSYRGDTTTSSVEVKACKVLLPKVSRVSAEKICNSHWRLVALGEGETMSY